MIAGFLVHSNNRNFTENYFTKVIYLLIGSVCFDGLWAIVNYGNWKWNYNSGALGLSYVFCICELVMEVVLLMAMMQYKDKEEKRKRLQKEQMLGKSYS
jgi:uncharacterized membrane protein